MNIFRTRTWCKVISEVGTDRKQLYYPRTQCGRNSMKLEVLKYKEYSPPGFFPTTLPLYRVLPSDLPCLCTQKHTVKLKILCGLICETVGKQQTK